MACYLGVDGGGSKTALALIDDTGRVIARTTAPTSYYFNDGFDIVEKSLAQGVTDICAQAGIGTADIDAAFFGLPGYGEASGDIEQLDAVPPACSATTGTAVTTTWCAAGPARSQARTVSTSSAEPGR